MVVAWPTPAACVCADCAQGAVALAAWGMTQADLRGRERGGWRFRSPGRYQSPPGKVSMPLCAPTRLYIVISV